MSGYMICVCPCINCGRTITPNLDHAPSLRIEGSREPLCEACFHKWNQIHRIDKGLEPVPLHPKAYEPQEVS